LRRILTAMLALAAGTAGATGLFHDTPSGPHALPGDNLPPFGVKDADGRLPPPPPLPLGMKWPAGGGPPESTAASPSLAEATRMATAAIRACAASGARVGVAVIDAAGEARVLLNAPGTDGSHGFVGMRKALVALAFARPSSTVAAHAQDPDVLARVTQAMFVEGGALPIRRGGRVIGAIGVSGAMGLPIGGHDEACAAAGLQR